MSKVLIGPQTLAFPAPVVLVGANVDGKPNFMAVAWCATVSTEPPSLSVSIQRVRHTYKGMRQNMTFSVNVPSADMLAEMDYCGSATSTKVDKVAACGFKIFYGKLENAPLIEQCPVNIECRVLHMIDMGSHCVFLGRIEEIHATDSCLTDSKPDSAKVNPILYAMGRNRQYHTLGPVIRDRGGPSMALRPKKK